MEAWLTQRLLILTPERGPHFICEVFIFHLTFKQKHWHPALNFILVLLNRVYNRPNHKSGAAFKCFLMTEPVCFTTYLSSSPKLQQKKKIFHCCLKCSCTWTHWSNVTFIIFFFFWNKLIKSCIMPFQTACSTTCYIITGIGFQGALLNRVASGWEVRSSNLNSLENLLCIDDVLNVPRAVAWVNRRARTWCHVFPLPRPYLSGNSQTLHTSPLVSAASFSQRLWGTLASSLQC